MAGGTDSPEEEEQESPYRNGVHIINSRSTSMHLGCSIPVLMLERNAWSSTEAGRTSGTGARCAGLPVAGAEFEECNKILAVREPWWFLIHQTLTPQSTSHILTSYLTGRYNQYGPLHCSSL